MQNYRRAHGSGLDGRRVKPIGALNSGESKDTFSFLGAKSTSILDCVCPSVGRSVPHDARLRGKIIVTSRLIREEEEEEETDYVAFPLRRVLRT
jgi:hypothetical protein